ncbi:Hypothetical protein SMAX5B_009631 [Scophthalmus maximus]|uniref:Uncharacterized protein n=1 Tax=Scophthalmus maximus TaxID=52904 RepID=A0A2U9C4L6_SCOMX|nr:Hypothetical protein SMAX5B_009631 [Scophthalmus maximus]
MRLEERSAPLDASSHPLIRSTVGGVHGEKGTAGPSHPPHDTGWTQQPSTGSRSRGQTERCARFCCTGSLSSRCSPTPLVQSASVKPQQQGEPTSAPDHSQ